MAYFRVNRKQKTHLYVYMYIVFSSFSVCWFSLFSFQFSLSFAGKMLPIFYLDYCIAWKCPEGLCLQKYASVKKSIKSLNFSYPLKYRRDTMLFILAYGDGSCWHGSYWHVP